MNKTTDRLSGKTSFKTNSTLVQQTPGKIVPQAVDLEEAVLGALMLEQSAVNAVIDVLVSTVFISQLTKNL